VPGHGDGLAHGAHRCLNITDANRTIATCTVPSGHRDAALMTTASFCRVLRQSTRGVVAWL